MSKLTEARELWARIAAETARGGITPAKLGVAAERILQALEEAQTIEIDISGKADLVGGKVPASQLPDMGGTYTNATPTEVAFGGIPLGSTFANKTMSEMWDALLYPELFPQVVAPSMSFTRNVDGVYEIGTTLNIALTGVFNRGSITPQYTAESDKRVGLPNTYIYSRPVGASVIRPTTSLSDILSEADYKVLLGENKWTCQVDYDAGKWPKSSKGNNCIGAEAAGSISKDIVIQGKYLMFWGTGTFSAAPDDGAVNDRITLLRYLHDFQDIKVSTFYLHPNTVDNEYWICVPPGLVVGSAYDETSNSTIVFPSVTDLSINDAGGTSATYKLYKIALGIPYSNAHVWRISLILG